MPEGGDMAIEEALRPDLLVPSQSDTSPHGHGTKGRARRIGLPGILEHARPCGSPPRDAVGSMNPLTRLRDTGQSICVDFLRRNFLTSEAGLARLIRQDGVSGVTSNPTIFRGAIAESTDYDNAIRTLLEHGTRAPREMLYRLAPGDVRVAADLLHPVYLQSRGVDGFVSFELEPRLAYDTAGSVAVARQLAEHIGKPNVMIKVPGTPDGVLAVEELTAAGVSVNITLLFSVERYEQVAEAYLSGLERRLNAGESLDRVASVASFFVSRVDTAVDALLPNGSPLRGHVAIANAKQAYQRFRRLFSGDRWHGLASAGAPVQRPLWASTGTKNPDCPTFATSRL